MKWETYQPPRVQTRPTWGFWVGMLNAFLVCSAVIALIWLVW
jgi:hypothetical protein